MFDVNVFYGENRPRWEPMCRFPDKNVTVQTVGNTFVFDHALDQKGCQSLIAQFDEQEVYPVGIDGYCDGSERPGSFRAMAWAPEMAIEVSKTFRNMLPHIFFSEGRDLYSGLETIPCPIKERAVYSRLGSTPWMRFMRYEDDGMHVPHYDASFHCLEESYRTLYSWVLYLNDVPDEQGGAFQFVDDGRRDHVADRPAEAFADWRRMAEAEEVTHTVQPRAGRMLVFPHWLCHQVQRFVGTQDCPRRYIIRGDLAYAIQ